MPLYVWKQEKTGKEVTVVRSVSDIEVPPTSEEVDDVEGWTRVHCAPVHVTKGDNWGPGKGNW